MLDLDQESQPIAVGQRQEGRSMVARVRLVGAAGGAERLGGC